MNEMEAWLELICGVAIFIIGILTGYAIGFDSGKFDEMQRRQRIQKGSGE